MSKYPKQTKIIDLDLGDDFTLSEKALIKDRVGLFVTAEMLTYMDSGVSPVAKRGKFTRLNADYADAKHGGDRTARLELFGDLKESIAWKNRAGDSLEIGVFGAKEQGKADGHNNLSGSSKLPTRRFIPDEGEKFKARIENGIRQIIKEEKKEKKEEKKLAESVDSLSEDTTNATQSLSDIDDIYGFDRFL